MVEPPNKMRTLIQSGEFAIGISETINHISMVELAAYSGFSFLQLHHYELVVAAEAVGVAKYVTFGRDPSPKEVAEALDYGADGVNFVLVETPEEVQRYINYAKLQPLGIREVFNGSRVGKFWGLTMEQFTEKANSAIVAVRIETKKGLENAEKIMSLPGLDMVAVGVSDLSRSLGVKRDSQTIMEAQSHIIRIAKAKGVAVLQIVMSPEEMGEWVKREPSLRLFLMATDGVQIGRAYRNIIRNYAELAVKNSASPLKFTSAVNAPMLPWLTDKKRKDRGRKLQ